MHEHKIEYLLIRPMRLLFLYKNYNYLFMNSSSDTSDIFVMLSIHKVLRLNEGFNIIIFQSIW